MAVAGAVRPGARSEPMPELADSHPHRAEAIATWLRSRGLSPEGVVLVISMLPIVELRGAVPVGINLFRIPWYAVVPLAVIGNMLPVFAILLFLNVAVRLLGRFRICRRFFDWLFARTRARSGLMRRWEFWGLVLFVSVPLPVTGAWTGSVAAVLMGLRYWRSVLAIALGVVFAGAVVTTLSLLGGWGAALAAVALLGLLVHGFLSGLRRRREALGRRSRDDRTD
ncbi:MAG TPA: hypothetical protein ENN51_07515 [candidate division WOR-3 bacterium]|uniref:Small multi-drug export protein n=1 Tax=candidate division WOR-3 bacterium TaxID=2052148 RepID=A0A7V0T785_UNCW3|nr:hypothetical protein [candidate division WOR-3 bacterium]